MKARQEEPLVVSAMLGLMTGLDWYAWETGGGCTTLSYNLPAGGGFNDPRWDGRYLMMTEEGGCTIPSRWEGEPILVGLYNAEGEPVECLRFESVQEFMGVWA